MLLKERSRGFQRWLGVGATLGRRLSPAGRAAIAELVASADQGLVPGDYDAMTLDGLARGMPHPSWSGCQAADAEVRLVA